MRRPRRDRAHEEARTAATAGRVGDLAIDPTQDRRDRFGRLLAYVTRAGVDFGRTMVLSGWARSYVYEDSYQRASTYRSAQSSARNAPRGVWRSCGGDFHRTA